MDRHYLNCFKLYLLIPPLSEGRQVTRRQGIIPTRRPGGQDLFRMNSCVSYFAQDTPSHLNGDGIDELSDPTDFTEDMGNTKSAVKLHTFLLQAIHTPNQKNSKIFRAAVHAIRAQSENCCGILRAVVTIAIAIAIAIASRLPRSKGTSLPA